MFYRASLAVYIFGALTLCVLSALYWSQLRSRPSRSSRVFPIFTLVCALAFASSLLSRWDVVPGALTVMVRNLAAGILPPLMLHLVMDLDSRVARWRRPLRFFYATGLASALLRGFYETGFLLTAGADLLYDAPALLLAITGAAGLFAARTVQPPSHRRWLITSLAALLISAAASLAGYGTFAAPLPDYILLAFFCVSLYYRERLLFIDVLLKRGVFLILGLVLAMALAPLTRDAALVAALGLWMLAPWLYSQLANAIDRRWFRRPYSPAGAERQFVHDIQAAASEPDLRERAIRSLQAIFQSEPEIRDTSAPVSGDGLEASFASGRLILHPRPDGIPFLSDDRRLLQALAGTFGVVMENVRFRVEQQSHAEREQQLRLLASRAELKALRAQINPHFLFNALSAIAGLIRYQPDLADETIEHLAQVFRYTLRKSDQEWALLGEEVEFVTAYLKVEQARFGRRLEVGISIDPAAERVLIPAMSIQPLIENAVRHGISTLESGGRIALRAALDAGQLSIEVSDNGPGFRPAFAPGHGLRNVTERLHGYYGEAAQLVWQSTPGSTRVVMRLPHTIEAGVPR